MFKKSLSFVVLRYAGYALQFFFSLTLAKCLAPIDYGKFTLFLIMVSAFTKLDFGLPATAGIILSKSRGKDFFQYKLVNNLNSLILLVLSLLIIIGFTFFKFGLILPGHGNSVFLFFSASVIAGVINSYQSNLLRSKGIFLPIALSTIILPVLGLITIYVFSKSSNLLLFSLFAYSTGNMLVACFYFLKSPHRLLLSADNRLIKILVFKSANLFLYSFTFAFITILLQQYISGVYKSVVVGYFGFAYLLSSSISLASESFMYVYYPSIISFFSERRVNITVQPFDTVIASVRSLFRDYILFNQIVFYFSIIIVEPLIQFFFPEYFDAVTYFRILALTYIVQSKVMGYQIWAQSQGREKHLLFSSIVTLVFLFLSLLILNYFGNINLIVVLLIWFVGNYLFYISLVYTLYYPWFGFRKAFVPLLRILIFDKDNIPLLISILLIFQNTNELLIIPLVLVLLFYYRDLLRLFNRVLISFKF